SRKHQVVAAHERGGAIDVGQDPNAFLRIELSNVFPALVLLIVDVIDKMPAVWKKLGRDVFRACVAWDCHRYGSTARLVDTEQSTGGWRKQKYTRAIPRSAKPAWGLGDRLNGTAVHVNFLQLSAGKERHRSTIRRPERISCVFGMLQRPGRERVKRPHRESPLVVRHIDEHDSRTVRR